MKPNIVRQVTLEFYSGTSVQVAIQTAREVSKMFGGCPVHFTFNDIHMEVYDDDSLDDAMDRYLQELRSRADRRLEALEDVFGMLNDLDPKEQKAFEKALKATKRSKRGDVNDGM